MSNLKSQNHILNLKSNIRYRAYHFSIKIISFITNLPEKRVFWIIGDQLLKCATSIGANLIEAKASSSSKKDFIKSYEIALKSANEALYWLSLIKDSNLIKEEKIESLIKEIKEIARMVASSLLTMKGKKIKI